VSSPDDENAAKTETKPRAESRVETLGATEAGLSVITPPVPRPADASPLTRWGRFSAFVAKVLVFVIRATALVLLVGLFVPVPALQKWASDILKILHENWRATILIVAALLYPQIAAVMRRVRKMPLGFELEAHLPQGSADNPLAKPDVPPKTEGK
jgi:fumarate reductase subunit D